MGIIMMEDRQKLWNEYQGAKPSYLEWPWLKYTRYIKAEHILQTLRELNEDITKLIVLDYGCGVGDYGFVFGRAGASVIFLDLPIYLDFIKYRASKEQIKADYLGVNEDPTLDKQDLVIFGEVLEHLNNPLETLKKFINKGIKYIYTSSYPYRSDDPNEAYWKHHKGNHTEAIKMQKPCRELLEANYEFMRYDGEARLWIKR
jgi:hypothetical protein